MATVMTLACSIPIIQNAGISTKSVKNMFATVSLFLITLNTLLGLMVKLMIITDAKSINIIRLKNVHKYGGYLVVLVCKVTTYIKSDLWITWLSIDVAFLALYVITKLYFPRLEAKGITPKHQEKVISVRSVRELDRDNDYIVFANRIYDIYPLRYNHPAGYQICQAYRNKEVDRFIYGSAVAEEVPEVPVWSHSYKCFTLMDDPVAIIDIPPTYGGFDSAEVECEIPEVLTVSEKGMLYQINLVKKGGLPFTYLKYREIAQLGRYFGLTLNNKVTRLYTTVNFLVLVPENIQFLMKHLNIEA